MVQGLPALEILNLGRNKITKLVVPANKQLLQKLVSLDMSMNDLVELPIDLHQFSSLKTLNVAYNFLITFPKQIADIGMLKTIDTSGNPAVDPPIEICQMGLRAMKRYWAVQPGEKKPFGKAASKKTLDTSALSADVANADTMTNGRV
jgi:Leucine-rich repeat (LRR) protein